ncbi:hypothetical protein ACWGQ5_56280 [Streptomyces sp. NPDC055722]
MGGQGLEHLALRGDGLLEVGQALARHGVLQDDRDALAVGEFRVGVREFHQGFQRGADRVDASGVAEHVGQDVADEPARHLGGDVGVEALPAVLVLVAVIVGAPQEVGEHHEAAFVLGRLVEGRVVQSFFDREGPGNVLHDSLAKEVGRGAGCAPGWVTDREGHPPNPRNPVVRHPDPGMGSGRRGGIAGQASCRAGASGLSGLLRAAS